MNNFIVVILIIVALPFILAAARMKQPKLHKKTVKRKPVDSPKIHIERFDSGDEIEYKIVNDVNRELTITYLDSEGSKTTRNINALQLHKRGNAWFLYAFCELRQANRHFRIVNFKKLVDHETGEIVEKRFVEYLRSI